MPVARAVPSGATGRVPPVKSSLSAGGSRDATDVASSVWWVWLVTGSSWLLLSIVLLRFDYASVSAISISSAW